MLVVAGELVLPVKIKLLNDEPVVMVGIDAPEVSERFGTVVDEAPAVWPDWNVLVTVIAEVNPPVPVHEKLVRVAIANTVCPRVVCANTILNVLNAMERMFEVFELKIPVVKSPPNVNAPAVNV